MEISIKKDQEFIILSSSVTNATKCTVVDTCDDSNFQIKLKTQEPYSPQEKVDLFSVAGSGVQYFETIIQKVEKNFLTIKMPEKYSLIQRREYTRAEISKNILIYTEDKTIRATITDISAGGMCLQTETEMNTKTDYQTDINLDKNLFVSCKFRPIRVNLGQENKYTVSGRFKLIKNIDRVAIAQYCLTKQAEEQNK